MYMKQIKDKANAEKYASKLPYNEGNTPEEKKESCKKYRVDDRKLHDEFRNDCRMVIDDCLGFENSDRSIKVTDKQFEAIFGKAWEDGHSSGYCEVTLYLEELIDLVSEFVKK